MPSTLLDSILDLRRDARRRGDVWVFDMLPLFVPIASLIGDAATHDAIKYAIDDGYGDPDDLDPCDDRQTSRLESAILSHADGILAIRELLTVEWKDGAYGPRSIGVCMARLRDAALLVIHDHYLLPAFHAIACGNERDLQQLAADQPHLVLPRVASTGSNVLQVVVRVPVAWTREDVAGIVAAIIDDGLRDGHIQREDLLALSANVVAVRG